MELPITINNKSVLNNTNFTYNVTLSYKEEDGLDDEGNTQYKTATKEYQGKITK